VYAAPTAIAHGLIPLEESMQVYSQLCPCEKVDLAIHSEETDYSRPRVLKDVDNSRIGEFHLRRPVRIQGDLYDLAVYTA
jgi:hypothetical protein